MKTITMKFNGKDYGPYIDFFDKNNIGFDSKKLSRKVENFVFKNKYNTTEIFLENKDIFICVGIFEGKNFLDIFNKSSKKTIRVFFDELNILFNTKDFLFINYIQNNIYYTKKIDINSLEEVNTKKSHIGVFYKIIYSYDQKSYFILELVDNGEYFELKKLDFLIEKPISFNKEKFAIYYGEFHTRNGNIKQYYYISQYLIDNKINKLNDEKYLIGDTIEKIKENKNFLNSQNYINSKRVRGIVYNYILLLFYKGVLKKNYINLKKGYKEDYLYFLFYLGPGILGFIYLFLDNEMDILVKITILLTGGIVWFILVYITFSSFINTFFNKKYLNIYNDIDKFYYNLKK